MRGLLTLAVCGCVGVALAAPAARAQQSGQRRDHASRSRGSGAPVADQFVSTPGQMVSTPGHGAAAPGQRVSTPGQMVTMPGLMVTTPGQTIAPTPGVIAPFHTQQPPSQGQTQSPEAGRQGVSAGRHHHNRHEYRPEYGSVGGYAVPYVAENGSSTQAANTGGSGSGYGLTPRTTVRANPEQMTSNSEPSLKDAPSGNRPAYHAEEPAAEPSVPASAPNVIQSREPVLTVVMKNGSKRRVRNYALTPQMLIDLDGAASGKEVKIPLSEVNLAATEKAAAQAGLSFAVHVS